MKSSSPCELAPAAVALLLTVMTCLAAPPPNDSFNTSVLVSGFPALSTGSNVQATLQPGEPEPSDYAGNVGASVWYRWVAPSTQVVQVDTFGSAFDTVLAVWTGSALTGLSEVSASDNSLSSHQSRLSFVANAGVTYRIAVYGYVYSDGLDLETGDIVLNIVAPPTGGISGMVSGPGGALANARVELYPMFGVSPAALEITTTDTDGRYGFLHLEPGYYYIRANHPSLVEGISADIFVDAVMVPNVNINLDPGATIHGLVTDDTGTPLAGIEVRFIRDLPYAIETVLTESDGTYSSPVLLAGPIHYVRVSNSTDPWLDQAYTDSSGFISPIVLNVGQTLTGIDFRLTRGGSISGVVRDADGQPLVGASVQLYNSQGQSQAYGSPDGGGAYSFQGLAGGIYYVKASHGGHVDQWFNPAHENANQGNPLGDNASIVPVVVGEETAGIDFALNLGGGIRGRVLDSHGDPVSLLVWAQRQGSIFGLGVPTDPLTGDFELRGLPAGDYILQTEDDANAPVPASLSVRHEWYDNLPAPVFMYSPHIAPDAAERITVTTGQTVIARNFVLAPVAPMTNDAFSAAIPLSGDSGRLAWDNLWATSEDLEPYVFYGGGSVWFSFTAPERGLLSLDTEDSEINTMLRVWRGMSLSNLVEVAANDNGLNGISPSLLEGVPLMAGRTVFIAVYSVAPAGFPMQTGGFLLRYAFTPEPAPPGRVMDARPAAATCTLTWTGVPQQEYFVWKSASIAGPYFLAPGGMLEHQQSHLFSEDGGIFEYEDPTFPPSPAAFYRVETHPPAPLEPAGTSP
ncbi:MAG: carboxypeptidase-like regulatory domain-containing protein [Kiritimatiellia bacterium]